MKYVAIFGMGCLTALGVGAMVTGTDHSILQLIIGGVIGMVSTMAGVAIERKNTK